VSARSCQPRSPMPFCGLSTAERGSGRCYPLFSLISSVQIPRCEASVRTTVYGALARHSLGGEREVLGYGLPIMKGQNSGYSGVTICARGVGDHPDRRCWTASRAFQILNAASWSHSQPALSTRAPFLKLMRMKIARRRKDLKRIFQAHGCPRRRKPC